MKDKVSIIVPIYNVEQYLKKCIDSLIAQTYENIEIVMIDDCSTDGSADIAKEYAKSFPDKCVFVQRKRNGGASAAKNSGIAVCTGQWMTFVDSDDWVTEDYVSSLYEVAVRDNADIVMSGVYYYYPKNGRVVEKNDRALSDLTTESSQREKIALPDPYATTRLYRKSFYDDVGLEFPTNVWRAEEQGITIPLLTRTDKISILRKPMYYYYQRDSSNSNQNYKNVDTTFMLQSIKNVETNSAEGFEKEIEYRNTVDILYAMILLMIYSGKNNKEIKQRVDWFNKKYPYWDRNVYLSRLAKGKRIFIWFAGKKMCIVLRIMVRARKMARKMLRR